MSLDFRSSLLKDTFVIEPILAHTHTFILLHGLGSNGQKFGTELVDTGLTSGGSSLSQAFPGAKFIFPTAKKRRSSAFRRTVLNQWFDIASLDNPLYRREVQLQGLAESGEYLRSLLIQEMDKLPAQNIILGGISQGCAMALFVLLGLDFPLAAFFGISGFLPFSDDINRACIEEEMGSHEDFFDKEAEEELSNVQPCVAAINHVRDLLTLEGIHPSIEEISARTCVATPVFLGHGQDDEKVNCKLGEEASLTLSQLGMQVTWKSYPHLGHWYKIPAEIDDIVGFLKSKVVFD